jgi:hypothetical protein
MPGCHRRQKQSIKEDAIRTWYQNLKRRIQEEKKRKKFIKEGKKKG